MKTASLLLTTILTVFPPTVAGAVAQVSPQDVNPAIDPTVSLIFSCPELLHDIKWC